MKKIYLASPFFTDEQRAVKARIKAHLETLVRDTEYEIADPQGNPDVRKWEKTNSLWGNDTYNKDRALLEECSLVIAIDWGLYGDCGTAWEVGFAAGRDIPAYVICPNAAVKQPHSLMVVNGSQHFIIEERFIELNKLDGLTACCYFPYGIVQK